mmetsp:Transcript_48370/g.96162  ORF Transcript_48370/g.96162 Transcript_48370/m.96162 type:complete len:294 (+) Transcript_48370:862-1743(+)
MQHQPNFSADQSILYVSYPSSQLKSGLLGSIRVVETTPAGTLGLGTSAGMLLVGLGTGTGTGRPGAGTGTGTGLPTATPAAGPVGKPAVEVDGACGRRPPEGALLPRRSVPKWRTPILPVTTSSTHTALATASVTDKPMQTLQSVERGTPPSSAFSSSYLCFSGRGGVFLATGACCTTGCRLGLSPKIAPSICRRGRRTTLRMSAPTPARFVIQSGIEPTPNFWQSSLLNTQQFFFRMSYARPGHSLLSSSTSLPKFSAEIDTFPIGTDSLNLWAVHVLGMIQKTPVPKCVLR